MERVLRRCLSFVLVITLIFSLVYAGPGCWLAVKTKASDVDISKILYVAQEGDARNGKITYVIYLKAGASLGCASIRVEFDDNVLEVSQGGAYTVLDSDGNETERIPGLYVSGLVHNKTNVFSCGYMNLSSYKSSKDVPFMRFTFSVKKYVDQTAVSFICYEFADGDDIYVVSPDETGPVTIFSDTVNIIPPVIIGKDNTKIDYENRVIRATVQCCSDINEILSFSASVTARPTASCVCGGLNLFGTGSIIAVTDNGITLDYLLVIEGDTNGDSVCDGLDAWQLGLASNGHLKLEGAYAFAADNNADSVIDINDFQAIVNKVVE